MSFLDRFKKHEITPLAHQDERIVLLSGDIGNRLFDKYKATCPDRFFNCGVAEANMISMGSGMALSGMIPIAYTIASFLVYRAYEQIRVDVAYHNNPMILVGVGGGLSYASNGSTHHTLEDIAIMRSLPNMQVICTADAYEVRGALRKAIASGKPTYIRIGKKGEPSIHDKVPANFKIGKALKIQDGKNIALIGTGNILPNVCEASKRLQQDGINPSIYDFHTIKPIDNETLKSIYTNYKYVFTIEEHSKIGGLGSAVLEWSITQREHCPKIACIGTPDKFLSYTGEQKHAREMVDLDPMGIYTQIKSVL